MALETHHQYENYSRHRLHFSGLYFATIAFCVACSLLLFALYLFSLKPSYWILLTAIGVGQILCAFVAWRLMKREMNYAKLMVLLEENANAEIVSKESGKFGARIMIIIAVFICGALMIALPFLHLF